MSKSHPQPQPQPKIFVSGKYQDHAEIHKKIQHLRSLNYEITHDWTQMEQLDRTPKAMGQYAQFDINGVLEADIHIIEMNDPHYAYRGTFTEIGASLTQPQKQIFIICPFLHTSASLPTPYPMTNVFFWHPQVQHFTSWHQVISKLEHLYRI